MAVFPIRPQTDPDARQRRGKVAPFLHWISALRWSDGLRSAARHMLSAVLAFVLSAAAVGTVELPVIYGLLLSAAPEWCTLLAAGAGCLGAVLFWRGAVLMELLSGIVVCLFVGAWAAGSKSRRKPWLLSALCGSITAILGLVFLLKTPEIRGADVGYLLVKTLAAVGAQLVFSRLWAQPGTGILAGAVGFTQLGLSQILLFRVLDLGLMAAAFLACAGFGLPVALLAGLGVDLTRITGVSISAIVCLTYLAGRLSHRRLPVILLPGALALAWELAAGRLDPVTPLSLTLGSLAALCVSQPQSRQQHRPGTEEARLVLGAAALEYLGECFAEPVPEGQAALPFFDQVAERVCGGCARWHKCWKEDLEQTYGLLAGAVPELLASGRLPETFLSACHRPEGFVEVTRHNLDRLRLTRQCGQRLAESRKALSGQYFFLARLLRGLSQPAAETGSPRYHQEVAMAMKGFFGRSGNGDRVAWFGGAGGRYYVILCDGMGTGREAAKEGQRALELLSGLLRTGLMPEEALQTLNDLYVLRETGGFSTADILEIRLDTGRACLYKWGGAPSYILGRDQVKRVGTAGPPPGVGIGEEHRPEVIRLSMQRGQTVVMVSDGLNPEEVQRRLRSCGDRTPKTVVSALTAGVKRPGEDDCTAVAVCLTSLSPGSL